MTLKIAYAGMTHLGICSAVGAAARGANVVGFDFDASRVEPLQSGRLPISEPDLPELLAEHRDSIRFSCDPADLRDRDVIFVAPDVPTDDAGRSDLAPVERLLARIDDAVPEGIPIVLLSQVSPGFTRSHPRRLGALFYQVETLIFGRAMERAVNPERFIVGCVDPDESLPSAYRGFLESFECPILAMRYESAELAKISINVCLAASLSAANTLAELCERIGAVWSEIVPALRLDKRIGPHAYIEAGLGIAGGNIERDLATVLRLSDELGTDGGVVAAFVANSRHRRDWALRTLHAHLPAKPSARIAVLGLAYKQDTASTKNSAALALAEALGPFELSVYDPLVSADRVTHSRVFPASTALAACAHAEVVAIMTPWRELRELKPLEIARAMSGNKVIDPFSVLDARACAEAGLEQLSLGRPAACGRR